MVYKDYLTVERNNCVISIPIDGLTHHQIKEVEKALSFVSVEPYKNNGVWVALFYDRSSMAIFDKEIDALRYCVDNNYDDVVFWEFGKNWNDVTMKPKSS